MFFIARNESPKAPFRTVLFIAGVRSVISPMSPIKGWRVARKYAMSRRQELEKIAAASIDSCIDIGGRDQRILTLRLPDCFPREPQ